MSEHPPATSDTVTSADGTSISWNRQGAGPALVMVHCVATSRAGTPQQTLASALAEHFTVYTYDRRGTGLSSTTGPYAVEREFEDLAAIASLADGPVDVYGFSSGATLALLAAESGADIRRLALLEPPLNPEPDPGLAVRDEAQRRIDADLADARHWFDTQVVGVPEEVLAGFHPSAEDLESTRTIVHELTFLPGTPPQRFAGVQTPTLIMASDHTAPSLLEWSAQLGEAMPRATHRVLAGGWHGVDDNTLTRTIVEYLSAE